MAKNKTAALKCATLLHELESTGHTRDRIAKDIGCSPTTLNPKRGWSNLTYRAVEGYRLRHCVDEKTFLVKVPAAGVRQFNDACVLLGVSTPVPVKL